MSHSQFSLFLLFCINTSGCNLADIVHLWSLFQRYNVTIDLEMNHQISIYCLLCNRIFEHGKNLKKGEPLISKQV